ncbi:MAG: hypothetical protein CMI55_01755 [Parcubacteria group bacterium]|nr:hypothetical protein [Parcubacteria group bacterium]|tara:strand:- start:2934 stop:3752 length:819 start_codon:yes stop_codon:yes gene_type:complete
MSNRLVKQIIIAFIFFSILAGIGFLIYYFNRTIPSCDDGILNQSEERIDCGGPCAPCQSINTEDLEVLLVKAVSAQDSFYDLIVQIRNPNKNYGSGRVPYRFRLNDVEKDLTLEFSGLTFILPNQSKYLIETKVEFSGQAPKIEFSLGEVEWQKLEDYQPPQLIVQQKEYRLLDGDQLGSSQARGVLVNKSNFGFEKINIDVLLLDSFQNILAVNTTEMKTLLAGQERDFFINWTGEIPGEVASVEIEAETDIFDSSNYLSPGGEPGRFQEY